MAFRCPSCGAVSSGTSCRACGLLPRVSKSEDPLIGKILADRYEITSLIGIGGMGCVYRANQRSLGREVAIKVIHPHLSDSDMLVDRFMTEAQAASRLNHPHVVSVFDFGRTSPPEGGYLFLVMELLNGVDLANVMRSEGPLPFGRIAAILGQTLEALAEAHDLGITHRDVKPENIVLTQRRWDRDHAKVIDFGIATMGASGKPTDGGPICGTPAYMAPEQAAGKALDARADLYSVGVVMFEMLTGRLPFEGATPATTLLRHMTAERPDPRKVAPGRAIPDSVAAVCLRALEIDPARRFQNAEAFQDALVLGVRPHLSASAPGGAANGEPGARPYRIGMAETLPQVEGLSPDDLVALRRASLGGTLAPATEGERTALIGRAQEVAWARDLLEKPVSPQALALWGRPGVGRTRLLEEIATIAERAGMLVARIPLDPVPRGGVGYSGLRKMILRLSGLTADDLRQGRPEGVSDRWAWTGFRALFDRTPTRLPADPSAVRRGAAAALAWAARYAAERAEGGRALMAIDDVERLDGASRLALGDMLEATPVPGFKLLVTGERSPGGILGHAPSQALRGLSRADAEAMLASRHHDAPGGRSDDDIEPLYIDQFLRLKPSERQGAPATLVALAAWRVQGLLPAQRRTLQAVAVTGGGPLERLALLLRRPDEIDEALQPLLDGGFLRLNSGEITATHVLLSRAAIAAAPGGAIVELHQAAADALASGHDQIELRAYHAIRGHADFQAFVLMEETARLRTARGDDQGAIAALWEAVGAARSQLMRGELETASAALSVFGRKLATALANDGSLDMAKGVLEEVLGVAAPRDAGRALLLEQLAAIAQLRGNAEETLRHRSEALAIAERCGDTNLAERLRAFVVSVGAGATSRRIAADASRAGLDAARPPSIPPRARPVLIVEDDKSIREGIKAVIESDGREAFVASNGREAIDVLRRIPTPGLILLDLMMPVMTGWEFLANLRADDEFSAIPVVIVSAVPSRHELGATRVVQKPVEVSVILSIVQEFCG